MFPSNNFFQKDGILFILIRNSDFREIMLYDRRNKTTPEAEQLIFINMAYALVKQWFGDYVSMDWWSSFWLKGGFAEFYQTHFEENVSLLINYINTISLYTIRTNDVCALL